MSRFPAALSAAVVGCVVWAAVPGASAAAGDSSIVPLTRAEAKLRPVLRLGDEGAWVRRLHRALDIRPVRAPFGRSTARAVKRFRVSAGLAKRPVVSVRTWMALGSRVTTPQKAVPAPAPEPSRESPPEFGYGDTSAWIRSAQVALAVTPATGYFGPVTRSAVLRFQAAAGLPLTGRLDAATWSALGDRVTAPATDVTTTELARTSQQHRASLGVTAFATSPTALSVVQRESGGDCGISSPGGTYRGKWQMDANFWRAYGGLEFAARADLATCDQQDLVAYRGWVDRWWQPWSGTAF